MAKFDFKQLLLEKGDKALMILGGVGLGGLMLWSLGAVFGGPDSPSTVTTALNNKADQVTRAVGQTEGGEVAPLPEWVKKTESFASIDPLQYPLASPVYEPINEPSRLRDQPIVLGPVPFDKGGGAQLSLIRAPMPAYDIKIGADGKVQIGVVKIIKIGANDKKQLEELRKGRRGTPRPTTPGNAPGGPGGAPGGFPGGAPGGAPGGFPGGGGPGGLGQGGPGGGGLGSGDGGGGGNPRGGGGPGGQFNPNEGRTETIVTYVTEEEFQKNASLVPALTVHPLRMVSVQMAFPLKLQFEEIRKALKLPTIDQAIIESKYAENGLFAGLEIERQALNRDGTFEEWTKFDHEEEYRQTILSRKLGDTVDDPYAALYTLPSYAQRLAAPLPLLADGLGEYEQVSLGCIADSIAKLKAKYSNKQPPTASNFTGGDRAQNPFLPQGSSSGAGSLFGGSPGFGSGEGPGFGSAPPSGGGGGPRGGGGPSGGGGGGGLSLGGPRGGGDGGPGSGMPGGPGMPGGAGIAGQGGPGQGVPPRSPSPPTLSNPLQGRDNYPLNEDYLLIRFLDPTVQTGQTYRYRVKIIMRNPNYQKNKDTLAKESYATAEKLESSWWNIPTNVQIPGESNFYSINPKKYEEKVKEKFSKNLGMQDLLLPKDGKTVVQVQQWAQQVRLNAQANTREPIGSWIIGEIPVGPGEYIGRKHLVQLPTWSAEKAAYALKEVPGSLKVRGGGKDTPKGWLVDFSTNAILVDFDGGKFRGQVAGYNVSDDADVEMLIVKPDGTSAIRSSAIDESLPLRENRNKKWDEWLKRAEATAQTLTGGPGGTGGGFGRPGEP